MQSSSTFIRTVSGDFLKHLHRNSFVPWSKFPPDRKKFLTALYEKLARGLYTPSFPRDYVVSNKHNYVARIVPSLTLEDYSVYYYCVKTLEKYLAVNRVEGTYGGFSLGGEFRRKENEEFNQLLEISFSVAPYTYNPLAWVKAWREFQKKARVYSSNPQFKFFLKYDIANFYNTINLTILEQKVRLYCPKEYTDEIDLLFFFLNFWNKRFLKYSAQTISIPQDEVGDCSRLLANFYVQDFDQEMYKKTSKSGSRYMRYSDDQVIMTTDKETAEDILFFTSKELFKIGLNINSAKVVRFDRKGWEYYWCFDIFDLLVDPKNITNIEIAIDSLEKLDKSKCRYDSILRRILNCQVNKVSLDRKLKFLSFVIQEDFLKDCDPRSIIAIYNLLGRGDKSKFLLKLKQLCLEVRFNSYHYNLLRAKRSGLPINFTKEIHEKINELKL